MGFTTKRNTAMPYVAGLDSAHMEAFEELAVEKVAARSALGMEFSLRGALNATPLLMILALERIAASNSRRANRDERCPTSLPLRRGQIAITGGGWGRASGEPPVRRGIHLLWAR